MNNFPLRCRWQTLLMGLLLMGTMLSLTSCISGTPSCEMLSRLEQRAGHQPAETLVRERASRVEQKRVGTEPNLVVITTADDLLRVKPYITQQAYARLTQLDLTSQFAIVIFSEEKFNDGYAFCATSWLRTGQEATVFVHLIQQPIMATILASYYDIFQINKDENWQGKFTLQLQYTKHEFYTNAYGQEISRAIPAGIVAETLIPTPQSEQAIELPFETIELTDPSQPSKPSESSIPTDWPDQWMDKNPGLFVIASFQEITGIRQYISAQAIAMLEQMDFSQSFALIAFDGWKSSLHYDFKIQKIIKNKDQVYVFVQPSQEGPQLTISSLYHLISIRKNGKWMQTFTFHLYIADKESNATPVALYIP